uniref:Tubby C-terminal domain-containing protein n=1 Tax=Globisporangium ultimum (strain ATCC 200006 / CBS 805.95 / DAOM BR144) TaxID=431595 RepID=K3WF24_GLOUD
MGGKASTEKFLSQALVLQRDFPFLVNTRFCKSSTTVIKLTDNFWAKASGTDGYAVMDAYSENVIFRVQDSVPGVEHDERTQWLTDTFKIPVAHLKKARTTTTAYNVYIGKGNDNLLTQLEIQYVPFQRDALRAEYLDPITGAANRISVHGNWRQRTAFITLDRDTGKGHQPIAKVFRADGKSVKFGNADYNVVVAPGVDVALVVLVCAAMDDALQQSMVNTKA